jgi:hypothetical protein
MISRCGCFTARGPLAGSRFRVASGLRSLRDLLAHRLRTTFARGLAIKAILPQGWKLFLVAGRENQHKRQAKQGRFHARVFAGGMPEAATESKRTRSSDFFIYPAPMMLS